MGFYKNRLTTTVTASLRHWRLRDENLVSGYIYQSVDPQFIDGELLAVEGKLVHYKQNEGFWPDHFILSTEVGTHFFLDSREQTR